MPSEIADANLTENLAYEKNFAIKNLLSFN